MVNLRLPLMAVILLTAATSAWAQYLPDPQVQDKIREARQAVTLTGWIAHADDLGGYYLIAGLAGNKIILNQNYRILKELARRRQKVKIDGRTNPFDFRPHYLFIDKIDSRSYHGDKAPLVKPSSKSRSLF